MSHWFQRSAWEPENGQYVADSRASRLQAFPARAHLWNRNNCKKFCAEFWPAYKAHWPWFLPGLFPKAIERRPAQWLAKSSDGKHDDVTYAIKAINREFGEGEEEFPASGTRHWGIKVPDTDEKGNPILDENGMQDMTKFCGDICDWIESSLKEVSTHIYVNTRLIY